MAVTILNNVVYHCKPSLSSDPQIVRFNSFPFKSATRNHEMKGVRFVQHGNHRFLLKLVTLLLGLLEKLKLNVINVQFTLIEIYI